MSFAAKPQIGISAPTPDGGSISVHGDGTVWPMVLPGGTRNQAHACELAPPPSKPTATARPDAGFTQSPLIIALPLRVSVFCRCSWIQMPGPAPFGDQRR